MAKGKQKHKDIDFGDDDPSLYDNPDDFNFDFDDSEMDLNEGEFGSKNRNPITRTGKILGKVATTTLGDEYFIRDTIREKLPKEVTTSIEQFDQIGAGVNKVYAEVNKNLKPGITAASKTLRSVIDRDSKVVPKWLNDKISEIAEGELASQRQNVEAERNDFIGAQLQELMTQQQESANTQLLAQTVENEKDRFIENERFNISSSLMQQMSQSLLNVDNYHRNFHTAYAKKHLEVSYRSLFVLQDMLAQNREATKSQLEQLAAISKNTALPDYVKYRGIEITKEIMYRKMQEKTTDPIATKGADITKKLFENLTKAAGEKARDISDSIMSGTDFISMMSEMREMSKDEFDDELYSGAIGMAVDMTVGDRIKGMVKKQVGKAWGKFEDSKYHKPTMRYLRKGTAFVDQAPHAIQNALNDSSVINNRLRAKEMEIEEREKLLEIAAKIQRGEEDTLSLDELEAGKEYLKKNWFIRKAGNIGMRMQKYALETADQHLDTIGSGIVSNQKAVRFEQVGAGNHYTKQEDILQSQRQVSDTIVKVIPRYLQHILREITTIRQSGTKTEDSVRAPMMHFDWDSGSLTTRKKIKEKFAAQAYDPKKASKLRESLARMINAGQWSLGKDDKGNPIPGLSDEGARALMDSIMVYWNRKPGSKVSLYTAEYFKEKLTGFNKMKPLPQDAENWLKLNIGNTGSSTEDAARRTTEKSIDRFENIDKYWQEAAENKKEIDPNALYVAARRAGYEHAHIASALKVNARDKTSLLGDTQYDFDFEKSNAKISSMLAEQSYSDAAKDFTKADEIEKRALEHSKEQTKLSNEEAKEAAKKQREHEKFIIKHDGGASLADQNTTVNNDTNNNEKAKRKQGKSQGGRIQKLAVGGAVVSPDEDGKDTSKSMTLGKDVILAGNEHVLTDKEVSIIGGGNIEEGHRRINEFRASIKGGAFTYKKDTLADGLMKGFSKVKDAIGQETSAIAQIGNLQLQSAAMRRKLDNGYKLSEEDINEFSSIAAKITGMNTQAVSLAVVYANTDTLARKLSQIAKMADVEQIKKAIENIANDNEDVKDIITAKDKAKDKITNAADKVKDKTQSLVQRFFPKEETDPVIKEEIVHKRLSNNKKEHQAAVIRNKLEAKRKITKSSFYATGDLEQRKIQTLLDNAMYTGDKKAIDKYTKILNEKYGVKTKKETIGDMKTEFLNKLKNKKETEPISHRDLAAAIKEYIDNLYEGKYVDYRKSGSIAKLLAAEVDSNPEVIAHMLDWTMHKTLVELLEASIPFRGKDSVLTLYQAIKKLYESAMPLADKVRQQLANDQTSAMLEHFTVNVNDKLKSPVKTQAQPVQEQESTEFQELTKACRQYVQTSGAQLQETALYQKLSAYTGIGVTKIKLILSVIPTHSLINILKPKDGPKILAAITSSPEKIKEYLKTGTATVSDAVKTKLNKNEKIDFGKTSFEDYRTAPTLKSQVKELGQQVLDTAQIKSKATIQSATEAVQAKNYQNSNEFVGPRRPMSDRIIDGINNALIKPEYGLEDEKATGPTIKEILLKLLDKKVEVLVKENKQTLSDKDIAEIREMILNDGILTKGILSEEIKERLKDVPKSPGIINMKGTSANDWLSFINDSIGARQPDVQSSNKQVVNKTETNRSIIEVIQEAINESFNSEDQSKIDPDHQEDLPDKNLQAADKAIQKHKSGKKNKKTKKQKSSQSKNKSIAGELEQTLEKTTDKIAKEDLLQENLQDTDKAKESIVKSYEKITEQITASGTKLQDAAAMSVNSFKSLISGLTTKQAAEYTQSVANAYTASTTVSGVIEKAHKGYSFNSNGAIPTNAHSQIEQSLELARQTAFANNEKIAKFAQEFSTTNNIEFKSEDDDTGFNGADIYISGQSKPVMKFKDIQTGYFIDATTGNVIEKASDIKGDIIDIRTGEIVVSADQLSSLVHIRIDRTKKGHAPWIKRGLLSRVIPIGTDVSKVMGSRIGAIMRGQYGASDLLGDMIKLPFLAADKIVKFALDRPADIYLSNGEGGTLGEPLLTKKKMKDGEYFNKDGTPIFTPTDIKGIVVDKYNDVIIDKEDLKTGICFKNGKKIQGPWIRFLKAAAGIALAPAKWALKGTWWLTKKANKMAGWMAGKGAKGLFSLSRDKGSIEETQTEVSIFQAQQLASINQGIAKINKDTDAQKKAEKSKQTRVGSWKDRLFGKKKEDAQTLIKPDDTPKEKSTFAKAMDFIKDWGPLILGGAALIGPMIMKSDFGKVMTDIGSGIKTTAVALYDVAKWFKDKGTAIFNGIDSLSQKIFGTGLSDTAKAGIVGAGALGTAAVVSKMSASKGAMVGISTAIKSTAGLITKLPGAKWLAIGGILYTIASLFDSDEGSSDDSDNSSDSGGVNSADSGGVGAGTALAATAAAGYAGKKIYDRVKAPSVSVGTPAAAPTVNTPAPSVSVDTPAAAPTVKTPAPSVSVDTPAAAPTVKTPVPKGFISKAGNVLGKAASLKGALITSAVSLGVNAIANENTLGGSSAIVGADIASSVTTGASLGSFAGPVGTAIGAAAGAAYGLWSNSDKLSQMWTQWKDLDTKSIRAVRYAGYGFTGATAQAMHRSMVAIENLFAKNLLKTSVTTQLQIDTKAMSVQDIAKLLGLDPAKPGSLEAADKWFVLRFKPVFEAHINALMQTVKLSREDLWKSLDNIDDEKDTVKSSYNTIALSMIPSVIASYTIEGSSLVSKIVMPTYSEVVNAHKAYAAANVANANSKNPTVQEGITKSNETKPLAPSGNASVNQDSSKMVRVSDSIAIGQARQKTNLGSSEQRQAQNTTPAGSTVQIGYTPRGTTEYRPTGDADSYISGTTMVRSNKDPINAAAGMYSTQKMYNPTQRDGDDVIEDLEYYDRDVTEAPKPTAIAEKGKPPGTLLGAKGGLYSGQRAMSFIRFGKNPEGTPIDLDGLIPEFRALLLGCIEEYGSRTGKTVQINSAARSSAQQAAMKKRFPDKAAPAGSSPHEFGFAVDMNTVDIDAMEKLGLMRKYGLCRPLSAESWHVEPIGIQLDYYRCKADRNYAIKMIMASPGRGGSGPGDTMREKGNKVRRITAMLKEIWDRPQLYITEDTQMADAKPLTQSASNPNIVKASYTPDAKPMNVQTASKAGPVGTDVEKESPIVNSKPQTTRTSYANAVDQAQAATMQKTVNDWRADSSGAVALKDFQVTGKTPKDIRATIIEASKAMGMNPDTPLLVAQLESSMGKNIQASTSSAKGIFQFTTDTWKEAVAMYIKDNGSDAGITGKEDPLDPRAGILVGLNFIRRRLQKGADAQELYLRHLLGDDGFNSFKNGTQSGKLPYQSVSAAAAKANANLFFKDGKDMKEPYTLEEFNEMLFRDKFVQAAANAGLSTVPGSSSQSITRPDYKQALNKSEQTANGSTRVNTVSPSQSSTAAAAAKSAPSTKVANYVPSTPTSQVDDPSEVKSRVTTTVRQTQSAAQDSLEPVKKVLEQSLSVQTEHLSIAKQMLEAIKEHVEISKAFNAKVPDKQNSPSTTPSSKPQSKTVNSGTIPAPTEFPSSTVNTNRKNYDMV